MKKILLNTLVISTAALTMAGCKVEEETGSGNSIAFSGTMEDLTVVLGDRNPEYHWTAGEKAGIFLEATVEMPFRIETSGASTRLLADAADLPESYGTMAYAYFPGTGEGKVFVDADIVIPEQQTCSAGHNPNALNLAATAPVTDAAAQLEFRHLGAVLDLGISSDEAITIGSIRVQASQPASGSYLAGRAKIDFLSGEPELDMSAIESGVNTIMVSFPEPLALSSTVQYIPVGLLPFSTTGGGLTVTLYDEAGNPCPVAPILTGDSAIGQGGAISLASGEYASYDLGKISSDQFLKPSEISIKVTDDKTQSVRAGQSVSLYSVMNTTETFIQTLTTDENGLAAVTLTAGDYKAYTAYNEGIPEEYNAINFSVEANNAETVDFIIYPYLFVDDFSWITSDMGGGQALLPYYGDISNMVINNVSPAWDDCSQELKDILAEKGWTFSQFVFPRPGELTLGKSKTTSTIQTPAFSGLSGTSDVEVTVIAVQYHRVSAGAWVEERSQLQITVNGGGTINGSSTLLEPEFESDPTQPDKATTYTFVINGATPQTSVSIANLQPGDATGNLWRCLIDEVRVLEAY